MFFIHPTIFEHSCFCFLTCLLPSTHIPQHRVSFRPLLFLFWINVLYHLQRRPLPTSIWPKQLHYSSSWDLRSIRRLFGGAQLRPGNPNLFIAEQRPDPDCLSWHVFRGWQGTYSAVGSTLCSNCSVGQFNPSNIQGSCTTCPAGYFCVRCDALLLEHVICSRPLFSPVRVFHKRSRCRLPSGFRSLPRRTHQAEALRCFALPRWDVLQRRGQRLHRLPSGPVRGQRRPAGVRRVRRGELLPGHGSRGRYRLLGRGVDLCRGGGVRPLRAGHLCGRGRHGLGFFFLSEWLV